MSFSTSLFMLLCDCGAHISGVRVLPASTNVLAPSIGWFFTSLVVRTRWSALYALLATLHGAVSIIIASKTGVSSALVNRACLYPLVASILAGVVGTFSKATRADWVWPLLLTAQVWSLVGGAVMIMCYPATLLQTLEPQSYRESRFAATARSIANHERKLHRELISGPGGVMLDTVAIKQSYPTSRWVMYFGGNGEFLENTVDDSDLVDLQANYIFYNPRGIGRSTGYVSQLSDLVEDAAAVAKYFVETEKIDPRNLLFLGHSIGGGVAARVAAQCFPEVALVLDRTFSSLSDAATTFSPFTARITEALVPILVGDLDTLVAWNRISHRRKLIIYTTRDEVIRYDSASIARLSQFRSGNKEAEYVVELHGRMIASWHNSELSLFQEYIALTERMSSFFLDKRR